MRWMIGLRIYFPSVHARFLQHLSALSWRGGKREKGREKEFSPHYSSKFSGGLRPPSPPPAGG